MKYVSVVPRKRSPFYTAAYFCPKKNARVWETTAFRVDDPQGKRKALNWASEKSKIASAAKGTGAENWAAWVPGFLSARYAGREKTLPRMEYGWKQWQSFLDTEGIAVPRGVDYNAVLRFVTWRSSQVKPASGKIVSKNTALCDTRIMSVVMREACRRGYADGNPCERLGIMRDRPKEKREITDAEIAKIRAELKTRPEWMRTTFEIALHQGCRHAETSLPFSRLDLDRCTITFEAKGRNGAPHIFTTKLHSGIVPLLRAIKDTGAKVTCTHPQMAAKEWWQFFREIGLPDLCFHCTRVTAVTKLARAGVPIQQAMAYIGHSSEAVHRIYQKLAAQDLSRAEDALNF